MARLVIHDEITYGGTLVPGQSLQLGGFTVSARPTLKPDMGLQIAENHLHVDLEKMDPVSTSALNEALDRIAALGVATDYDQVGLKPDQREIKSPPITHLVAVVEEPAENNSPPALKTSYVRISEHTQPNTPLRGEPVGLPNIEPGITPVVGLTRQMS